MEKGVIQNVIPYKGNFGATEDFFLFRPPSKNWIALEVEKEDLLNENSEIVPEDENLRITISYLMYQLISLLVQA